MKLFKFFFILTSFVFLNACNPNEEHHNHVEYDEFKKEIEALKIKLEATEAQLLNVRSELANSKVNDSTKVIIEKAEE